MKRAIPPAVALLLAACGGGGSDSPAVSANPPAPAPATPAAPTQPPPAAPAPVGTPIGGPKPNPAPIPSPVSPPPVVEPPAGGARLTVKGARIADALSFGINVSRHLPWVNEPNFTLNQYQMFPVEGRRFFEFGQFSRINATGRPWVGMTIAASADRLQMPTGTGMRVGATLRAQASPQGQGYAPPDVTNPTQTMIADTTPVFASEGAGELLIEPDEDIDLDRTLMTWRNGRYFVQYQVHSVLNRPELFRSCWHVLLPSVVRLACYTWSPDGVIGESVSDDSDGLGQRRYSTGP